MAPFWKEQFQPTGGCWFKSRSSQFVFVQYLILCFAIDLHWFDCLSSLFYAYL